MFVRNCNSKPSFLANSRIWTEFVRFFFFFSFFRGGGREGEGGSSPWLWWSSPPPVTPLTITLSELFLWLCGKMAERKCVYTIILLSVCMQFDLDQKFSLECCQAFFLSIFYFLSTPTHISLTLTPSLSFSLFPPKPSPCLCGTLSSPVTEEADRIAIAITWLVTLC